MSMTVRLFANALLMSLSTYGLWAYSLMSLSTYGMGVFSTVVSLAVWSIVRSK
jgi:hypothetical protein